jgi:hypothetical protein
MSSSLVANIPVGHRGKARLAGLICTALLIQGCAGVKSSFRVNEAIGLGNSPEEIGSCASDDNEDNVGSLKPINVHCYKFPGTAAGSMTAYQMGLDCAQKAIASGAADALCRYYRSALQGVVMQRSNAICDQHKGDILAQAALGNLGFGIAATGTASLGAVLSGIRGKSNLAALTAFLTGSQAQFNQELYQKQFAGAIISAIGTSRDQKKSEIDQKRSKSIADYTFEESLIDAQDYHYRCAFYHGVSLITKAVERQDQSSRAKLLARIDALRTEYTKASTIADPAHKASQTGKLARDIEELQSQLKAAID